MSEFTLADQVADLLPHLTSSGQEWQFQVSYKQINWQIYPHTQTNALWDIYYGMYLAAILDSSRKGGNFSFISE